jgi:hypothetical protein
MIRQAYIWIDLGSQAERRHQEARKEDRRIHRTHEGLEGLEEVQWHFNSGAVRVKGRQKEKRRKELMITEAAYEHTYASLLEMSTTYLKVVGHRSLIAGYALRGPKRGFDWFIVRPGR